MSALTLWNPSREMVSLRDAIDHLFDDSLVRPNDWLTFGRVGAGAIPLDVYEEGNNLVVKASVPGIKSDGLHVEVRDDVLTISGETSDKKERKEQDYYLHEHRYGRFSRSVTLPCPVLVDKAEAVFADGVLTLTLPKTAEASSKQIPIKEKK